MQTFEKIRNLVLYSNPTCTLQAFSLFYDMLTHLENEVEKSELSISEIAAECGFTNLYHFDRIFKDKTGQSPTEFSKLYKNIL